MITTTRITTAFITNPARDYPEDYQFVTLGKSKVLAFKNGGSIADAVIFGFVADSNIVRGKTYTRNNQAFLVKSLDVVPIEREGDRFLAMLSMVADSKPMLLKTSKDGAISFATRHTAIDENGKPAEGTLYDVSTCVLALTFSCFGAKSSRIASRSAPLMNHLSSTWRGRIHKDIQRRTREGTDPGAQYLLFS